MTPRNSRLWGLHDFTQGRGLEIGPLAAAIARKDEADVYYSDVFQREELVKHYRSHGVDTDLIPEIDFPLWDGERMRTLGESAKAGAPFDWVSASHVIEHVPNLIGWLREIADLTTDDGALVLVVPDRRYCFDSHRPPTTVGQMLQAYDAGDTIPSVRAVYDFFRATVEMHARDYWAGDFPSYDDRIHSLELTLSRVADARAGKYVDAHVWTWTPESFVETIDELRLLGLCSWKVESLQPTPVDELEFLVVLRRVPEVPMGPLGPVSAVGPGSEVAELVRDSARSTPDWVQRDELMELRQQIADLQASLAGQRQKIRRLRGRVARKEAELAAIRASRRWKVAGHLASPAAAVRRIKRSR
jgi:SAM-dependent methyltransferase